MELIDYLRLLRRRWRYVVVPMVLGLLLAVTYILITPKAYTASTDLFVGSVPTAANTPAAEQATQSFTLDRMPSYAALVDATVVLRQVKERSGVTLTPAALSSELSAAQIGKTILLRVTATDSNAARAAQIANTAAMVLGENIAALERPAGGGASPIAPTVTRTDSAPSRPSSPNKNLALALGLVAGLGFGLVLAALVDQAGRRQSTTPVQGQFARRANGRSTDQVDRPAIQSNPL